MNLRTRVIRLAYQNPPLRPHLLPILKSAALPPAQTWLEMQLGKVFHSEAAGHEFWFIPQVPTKSGTAKGLLVAWSIVDQRKPPKAKQSSLPERDLSGPRWKVVTATNIPDDVVDRFRDAGVRVASVREAGDVIPFAGRAPRNSHTVTLAGDKYVLSTHSGGMMGDLMELPEEAEEGARIIHVRPEDPWKYLWAYDTDHQVLAMWRVSDGNEKEYGSARSQTALLVKLDKKGELNRVTGAQFRAIETAMRAQEEAHTRALEQWVEETKTTSQRDVDALVREYFDTKVRPAMDRAVSDVERGATPLGFKADPGGFPVDRQMKSYVTGKLYEKLLDLDVIDAYVRSRGVDLDAIDSQATQWARDDVWFDYLKSVLR